MSSSVNYPVGGGVAQAPVYVPPNRAMAPSQYGHGHHFVGGNPVTQNPWHHATPDSYGEFLIFFWVSILFLDGGYVPEIAEKN